jgi:hypothetical protein
MDKEAGQTFAIPDIDCQIVKFHWMSVARPHNVAMKPVDLHKM